MVPPVLAACEVAPDAAPAEPAATARHAPNTTVANLSHSFLDTKASPFKESLGGSAALRAPTRDRTHPPYLTEIHAFS
jgi:hypothetical protein